MRKISRVGTNYYQRNALCKCCGRYDDLHIGKSSQGWTFTFRGHRKTDSFDVPVVVIESYKDWLIQLEKNPLIYNEYGNRISLEAFKDLVESKRDEPNNHTNYCRSHYKDDTDIILDEEGNSFTFTQFS